MSIDSLTLLNLLHGLTFGPFHLMKDQEGIQPYVFEPLLAEVSPLLIDEQFTSACQSVLIVRVWLDQLAYG